VARILLIVAAAGLALSSIFFLLALLAAMRHLRRAAAARAAVERVSDAELPPVSVLKPLHGMEPGLEENLESFFLQQYPRFELIFGAREEGDAGLQLARRLAAHYPSVPARFIVSGEPRYPNAKIYSLEKMLAVAQHEMLIISDSDVRLAPDCLRSVIPPLLDPLTGMVTCAYRGLPVGGLWSRLEALGMSVEMTSGVLIADMLEGMRFALGPLMATRRAVLQATGGLASLGHYCADDYVMGNRVAAAGLRVVLSHHVIEHVCVNRTLRQSLAHQVRWMRSTRFSRPKGHLGTGITFAMPFGVLGLVAGWAGGMATVGAALFAWAFLSRVLQSAAIGWGVLRDPGALRFAWLYPLRDLMGFFFWVASYAGGVVVWRGERYRMMPGGRMVRAIPKA
jgi:ceramide glucosyltransferase